MCRGLEKNERERLKIKAFYLRLSLSTTQNNNNKPIPDSLTLHYLPRINGSPLDVDGSTVRPDSPAFLTLHRAVSASPEKPVFGSRERVAAGGGVRFDVYFGEEKLLRGVFRRDEGGDQWRVECKCVLERDVDGVKAAEVWVEAEGQAAMSEKVAVAVRRRRRRGNACWFQGLEEIPEEREGEDEAEGCCRCCCSEEEREGASDGGDGGEVASGKEGEGMEMEIEGVRLAVDVGFWVVCLGVGYLVSSLSRIKMP